MCQKLNKQILHNLHSCYILKFTSCYLHMLHICYLENVYFIFDKLLVLLFRSGISFRFFGKICSRVAQHNILEWQVEQVESIYK